MNANFVLATATDEELQNALTLNSATATYYKSAGNWGAWNIYQNYVHEVIAEINKRKVGA